MSFNSCGTAKSPAALPASSLLLMFLSTSFASASFNASLLRSRRSAPSGVSHFETFLNPDAAGVREGLSSLSRSDRVATRAFFPSALELPQTVLVVEAMSQSVSSVSPQSTCRPRLHGTPDLTRSEYIRRSTWHCYFSLRATLRTCIWDSFCSTVLRISLRSRPTRLKSLSPWTALYPNELMNLATLLLAHMVLQLRSSELRCS